MTRTLSRGATPALALLLLPIWAATGSAETRVGGAITEDTVWTKDGSPYIAYEDVVVPEGRTLTIEPGVSVRFKANINDQEGTNRFDLELLVHGTLVTRGAARDTVYFSSDAPRITWLDWQGIVVTETGFADIQATNIQYANVGIRVLGGRIDVRDSSIRNCDQAGVHFSGGGGVLDNVVCERIGNFGGTGIGVWLDKGAAADISSSFLVGCQNGVMYSRGSSGLLEYSVVSLATGKGILIRKSTPVIRNTNVVGNEWGIEISGGAEPVIKRNNIFNNGTADVWLRDYRGEIVKLDLTLNFWDTRELSVIEDHILDGLDNTDEKAFAIIEPFLDEAVSTDKAFDQGAGDGAQDR